MARRGKRAKRKSPQFTKGQRVIAPWDDGHTYEARIVNHDPSSDSYHVVFDDGAEATYLGNQLKLEELIEDGTEQDTRQASYAVKWNGRNFIVKLHAEPDAKFNGHWRKTRFSDGTECYAIDIYADYHKRHYCVNTITYSDDPWQNPESRDADICAAINRFLYDRLSGDLDTLDELQRKADRPMLHIKNLKTIDTIILKLREFRDTAIRSGGTRTMALHGDRESDPIVAVEIDVTSAAMVLEGRVPSLTEGAIYDPEPVEGKGKKRRKREPLTIQGDPANIEALLKQLSSATDKSAARKLRAQLRKLGHRGGRRTK